LRDAEFVADPKGDDGGVAHGWRFWCAAKDEMVRTVSPDGV